MNSNIYLGRLVGNKSKRVIDTSARTLQNMVYQPRLSHLKIAYNNPYVISNKLRQATDPFRRKLFIKRYGEMTDVIEQDWDNLIILDACRFDTFKQRNTIDGELTKATSKGSHSSEFIKYNYLGRELSDTIYITSNPQAESIENGTFFKLMKTYSKESVEDRFDYSGIHPEELVEMATATLDEHPNKRVIIHFMQPHTPYLGEYASELHKRVSEEYDISFERVQSSGNSAKKSETINDLRVAEKRGYISREQLVRAYEENLDLVLDYVKTLLQEISGKSVITSDHGEILGDTSSFLYNQLPFVHKHGHPAKTYLPELRYVPWLVVEDYSERREVIKEEPIGTDRVKESTVEEHLKALGYT